MSAVTIDQIKSLRERTGVSMQACKKALDESDGDEAKAVEILRKKGEARAVERGERRTGEGLINSYVHGNNKLGVLLSLGCETDFVARSEDFKTLARDIAMHIAAMNPLYASPEEVPNELIEKEREIWRAQLARENKPQKIMDSILAGKEKKFREEVSLLTQSFVKNPDITVSKLLSDAVLKLGENIKIHRFIRYSL